MNELLRGIDPITILRKAYQREANARVKKLINSLTDEQLLTGNF